jgi:ERCC4-type nuclease
VRELGDVVKRERLDVGDFHLITDHGRIIVERKRWADLQSSLNDGRYSNQKMRLLAERERSEDGKTHVVVLIESKNVPFFDGESNNRKNKSAFCALSKMSIRDRVGVVWAADSDDAAKHVAYMFSALSKNGFSSEEKAKTIIAGGYSAVSKHTSKRKNAEDSAFEIMLTTIGGVSGQRAVCIAREYKSMADLVQAYVRMQTAGASEGELDHMLADLDNGGKRLGPSVSTSVRRAVFPKV